MSDLRAPLHRLSSVLDRLAVTSNALRVACEEVLQSKKALVAHVEASIRQFQATVADVICKINEHAASSTAGLRLLCHNREKVLDAQTDELTVSVGQLIVYINAGKAALALRHRASAMRALQAATGVQELCKLDLKSRVPFKLDIIVDACDLVRRLEHMAELRLYDVDKIRSTVSGFGLVSCVKDTGAVNKVKVNCKNSAGERTEWVTVMDVLVIVRNIVCGKIIGRGVDGRVVKKGVITIKYEVDDVDVDEVELSVSVGGVMMHGSPWRVVLSVIKTDAVQVMTYPLTATRYFGVAVTFDGRHLVVSNVGSANIISVYSTDTGSCITTFGNLGAGAGQFYKATRICATPSGTLIISDSGNRRLQEVTLGGEHVRYLGEGLMDNESVFALCMHGDIVAVGKRGGDSNGRIVLLNYLSGALIRKFGSYGSDEGQIGQVAGLSFVPDGMHIVIAETVARLSLFAVDGTFVKTIGAGDVGGGLMDVLCLGHDIFVADYWYSRVCVFSSKTGAFIRSWGAYGKADGQFHYPTALAAHKHKLFVLELNNTWVQAFE